MDSERAPWTRCVLFSIAIRFPKLDVAGSIPVSRSSHQQVTRHSATEQFFGNFITIPEERVRVMARLQDTVKHVAKEGGVFRG